MALKCVPGARVACEDTGVPQEAGAGHGDEHLSGPVSSVKDGETNRGYPTPGPRGPERLTGSPSPGTGQEIFCLDTPNICPWDLVKGTPSEGGHRIFGQEKH